MSKDQKRLPLLQHALDAPSAFTPENLLEAVRAERDLPRDPVPEVCVLEFDGDLTDWLVGAGLATRRHPWACFHTSMETVEVDGERVGVIARTIGGPYAVLVAEQLAASGVRVILGLTSAGQVSPGLKIPSLVIPTTAIRDEGTSYHYLPAAESVDGDASLALALQTELGGLGLPVVTGPVWTTDAPYRETSEQLQQHASKGVLAVEMQAASLFAFGAARGVRCGVVAHVTNGVDHSVEAQFEKGAHQLGFEILKAMARASKRCSQDC
ncbi:MAG: nucleoside phosphorylase [Acidobacteria bacterium]|jgi:uridine phosphorylase|nr:nucleoside phosphorylase [Acidobacteriota bacterium]